METPNEYAFAMPHPTRHRPATVTSVKVIANRHQTCTPDVHVHFPRRRWMTFAALAFNVLVLPPSCLVAAPAAPTTVMVTPP